MTQAVSDEVEQKFVPCPLCKQYSHSIGDDRLAAAFNHFQLMIAHPMRGHPMGDAFDEQTRDAAQVLMAAAMRPQPSGEVMEAMVEAGRAVMNRLASEQCDDFRILLPAIYLAMRPHDPDVKSLVEALMPFADFADYLDAETSGFSDTDELELSINDHSLFEFKVGQFRAAQSALAPFKDRGMTR